MYNMWRHDVLCYLCEQEERAKLVVEVEQADEGKRNLEYQLETCRKEMYSLHQQYKKEMSDHQVSECGLTPLQQNHLFSSPYSWSGWVTVLCIHIDA